MQGDREHAGIVVERRLGAVAVVDVPVDDGDASEAARGAQVVCRDGDVAEQAEPHALARERVVTRRAAERVDVVDLAVEHGVAGGHHAAGREQGDLVRAGPERRQPARVAAVVVRQRLDVVDVGALVEAADLLDGGHPRLDRPQLRRDPRSVHEVLEAPLGERVLGVRVRLDPAPGGERRRSVSRVVPHVALVPDQSGRHRRLPCRSCGRPGSWIARARAIRQATDAAAQGVEFRRDRVPCDLLARPAVARDRARGRAHGEGRARRALHGRDRRGRDAPRGDRLGRVSRRLAPERVGSRATAARKPSSSPSRRSSKGSTTRNACRKCSTRTAPDAR